MPISKDEQIEIEFRTRKLAGEGFDLLAVIQRVAAGCRNIQQGEPFSDSDAALAFMREYALVRDLHLAGHHAEQLKKYGVTTESLAKCKEIITIFEKPKSEHKMDATLFASMKTPRFDAAHLETLFTTLALTAKLPANKRSS